MRGVVGVVVAGDVVMPLVMPNPAGVPLVLQVVVPAVDVAAAVGGGVPFPRQVPVGDCMAFLTVVPVLDGMSAFAVSAVFDPVTVPS